MPSRDRAYLLKPADNTIQSSQSRRLLGTAYLLGGVFGIAAARFSQRTDDLLDAVSSISAARFKLFCECPGLSGTKRSGICVAPSLDESFKWACKEE
ncbi:hypothetical protein AKJ16_DCAP21923 [Drosera capensis]